MAEVQQQQTSHRSRRKPHGIIRIDMTPMVDLAFLLLTFFVLTSELSKQNAITTVFPKEGPETTLVDNGLTVLLGKDPGKIYWYRGKFDPAMHLNVAGPGKNGLFDVLKQANPVYAPVAVADRQHDLGLLSDDAWKTQRETLYKNYDNAVPFVIVKWDESASYESVVNAIDDLNRSLNRKYAVVAMTQVEKETIANK
jgi:biopolymer transport protein ExbD